MYKISTLIALSLSTILLSGCGGGGSSDGDEEVDQNINLKITNDYEAIPLKSASYTIDIQTDHTTNLYLVLTNTDGTEIKNIDIEHNGKLLYKNQKQISTDRTFISTHKVPEFITNFNNQKHLTNKINSSSKQAKSLDIKKTPKNIGDTHTFKVENNDGTITYKDATLKSKVTVNTRYGYKTLLVWVSDDTFEGSCYKAKCITQTMVDELQEEFLQDGSNNDIYDWVTNIYGEEWSQNAHDKYPSDLIDATDEINIFFTDIEDDNSANGGMMGYFYAKDNFYTSTYPNSNEMIMFYVDSIMFANEDGNGFWQKEMYSTLAHEFQHMIHFYQKTVLKDKVDDTWINELISETTEDLIATKINHIGPRGVDPSDGSAGEYGNQNGRYPLFNQSNDISISQWYGNLENYSNVNSFGAFLTRNYGGAKVLHDILYNNKEHEDAIEYATGENFGTLLQKWGEAVILSSIENPYDVPTYNFGDFKNISYNGITYNLGSIDFFRYLPMPKLYSLYNGNTISLNPHSNKYYIIGEELDGTIDLDISLPTGTKAVLIAK